MRPEVEAFRAYLIDDEKSPSTIRSYCYAVESFLEEYGTLTKEHAVSYKLGQVAGYAPKTAANRTTAVNRFCDFIGRHDCKVKTVRVQAKPTVENVITVDQYEQMIAGLLGDGNIRGYWMTVFLAKTGARISEFVRLDKSGLETGICEMWTKGKIRRIRIPDILIYESADYFKNVPGDLLFPNRFGVQMTTRGAAADLARWAVKYGVPRERAHPHAFRHLYAIEFLKVNKDIALLKDLMGHENINTTAGYLTLSEEQQREEFNKAIERQEMHRPDIRIRKREAQKKA